MSDMMEAAAEMPEPDPGAPTVSIIVISYNTRDMTLDCLRSVVEQTPDLPYELIVLDNASTDGSADAIAEAFPGINLIRLEENVGFAGGNNRAAECAAAPYLLLLNPDTLILDRAVERVVAFAERAPAAGIWGGRTLFADGSLNRTSAWGEQTLWSVFCWSTGLTAVFPRSSRFNSEAIGGWARDSEREVDIVTGCFLLITRDLWRALGGFDEDFFMFAEEADLCRRARDLGARPRLTPDAQLVHFGGASTELRVERSKQVLKGKISLMKKHWSPAAVWLGRRLFRLWVLTRWAGFGLSGRLRGQERHRREATEYAKLWQIRSQWLEGWPMRGD